MADTVRMRIVFWLIGLIATVSMGTSAYTVSTLNSLVNDIHTVDKRVIAIESSRVKPSDLKDVESKLDLKIEAIRQGQQLVQVQIAGLEARTPKRFE